MRMFSAKVFFMLSLVVLVLSSSWFALADHQPVSSRAFNLGASNAGPSIWLQPLPDLQELFSSGGSLEEWDRIAKHVHVVRFTAGFFKNVPDDVLARMVKDFERHHIAIGCQLLALNWVGQPPCGKGVEGYGAPPEAKAVVAKIQKAGGRLAVVSMDEPLWFGHYYDGKNCCHSSIDNIVERTASIVKVYTDAFPDVVVGDTEPFPSISNEPRWKADYREWCSKFKTATGYPLSFLQMDFAWGNKALTLGKDHTGPNPDAIKTLAREVAEVARENHETVGFMFTGAHSDSDEEWLKQAKQHINIVQASGINPDQAIFITWTKVPGTNELRPARLMPSTDNTTLGGLVHYYYTQFMAKP